MLPTSIFWYLSCQLALVVSVIHPKPQNQHLDGRNGIWTQDKYL
jgi:hypothetical protein